jgi:oligoendopeptidase F
MNEPALHASAPATARVDAGPDVGALPEWDLANLYAGPDAPALRHDLERADAECLAFEEAFRGRLAEMVAGPDAGAALAAAVRRYEAIDDLIGRITSYATLLHAADTMDPARTKFLSGVQERMTAASSSSVAGPVTIDTAGPQSPSSSAT